MTALRRTGPLVLGLLLALAASACGGDDAASTSTASPFSTTLVETTTIAPTTNATTTTTTASTTTTTSAPPTGGVEEPELFLIITDPVNGQIVDSEWYDFRGSTAPGATVLAAGDIVVPVAADGSWTIRLRLVPGSNLATIVAEDEAGGRVIAQVQIVFEVPGGGDPPIFSP